MFFFLGVYMLKSYCISILYSFFHLSNCEQFAILLETLYTHFNGFSCMHSENLFTHSHCWKIKLFPFLLWLNFTLNSQ